MANAQTPVQSSVLARLANSSVEAAVQNLGALPLDIQEAVNRQMAEARLAVSNAAATEIVNLMMAKDAQLVTDQNAIVGLEGQIAGLKSHQQAIARAWAYDNATRNYVPLSLILGFGDGGAPKELQKIPADWTAPAADAPAAA